MENKALNTAYKNPALPVSDRVEKSAFTMIIEEKVAQLCGNGVMRENSMTSHKKFPTAAGISTLHSWLGESEQRLVQIH